MPVILFLRENLRWIAGGFLLTFFSSFGQTYFISLSAGNIRSEYGLSHGEFGAIYMAATLCSAAVLPFVGRIVDRYSVMIVTCMIIPPLAAGALAMAFTTHVVVLVGVIFVLRLFGQGMMTQNALTATGRWFAANRGRAVSFVTLGHNTGEAVFPILFVFVAGLVGWRASWIMGAAVLVLVALPAIAMLYRVERQPRASDPEEKVRAPRNWTRAEVMRDPAFWLLLCGTLAPSFIGTTIFFHQVYLVELRGWSLEVFAASFVLMSGTTIVCALVAGVLVDRFSAVAMLSTFLVPLGAACLVLGFFDQQWSAFAFMVLLGVSYGISSTLFGSVWPELYGVANLGAIRAVVVAIMVFATAMGPGVTGALIDLGVSYPGQIAAMGFYCLAIAVVMTLLSRHLVRRNLALAKAGSVG